MFYCTTINILVLYNHVSHFGYSQKKVASRTGIQISVQCCLKRQKVNLGPGTILPPLHCDRTRGSAWGQSTWILPLTSSMTLSKFLNSLSLSLLSCKMAVIESSSGVIVTLSEKLCNRLEIVPSTQYVLYTFQLLLLRGTVEPQWDRGRIKTLSHEIRIALIIQRINLRGRMLQKENQFTSIILKVQGVRMIHNSFQSKR